MKYRDCESQADVIDYYETLMDFLDDHVACLDELIAMFEAEDE